MNYIDYMYRFELSELIEYLGADIVETLVEWLPDGENLLTRTQLISMIDSVYGLKMFENKKFRYDMIKCMDVDDIYHIRNKALSKKEQNIDDVEKLVEIIAHKPWKMNKTTECLLELWGIPSTIFDRAKDNICTKNLISSGERFYELLDYQFFIKQQILNILNSSHLQERMLIHMPTGTGKTKTSIHTIINYYQFSLNKKGAIIWIAHTKELLQQAYDTFEDVWSHLGDGEVTAYKLWERHNIDNVEAQIDGFVFCGLSKLMSIYDSNKPLFNRLCKDARLIVFDEAHKAAASKTKKIVENMLIMPKGYSNRALIGLTATPGRTTNDSYDNNLLTDMFGGKLITIDGNVLNRMNLGKYEALNTIVETNIIKYFQNRKILSKMKIERLEYRTTFSSFEINQMKSSLKDLGFGDKDFTEKQLQVFAKNKDRNKVIMQKLESLARDKVPTIVFACSVEHAKMLSAMLILRNIENSIVIGDMNPVDRAKAINDFKNNKCNIIINYEVLTTGFDSKNIRCVFITRPTQSVVLYSQMLGRGLRGPLMGGNETCLLVDVNDNLEAYNNEMAFSHFDSYWNNI